MPSRKQRKLDSTAAVLHRRYGPRALRKASELAERPTPPHVKTGFVALDTGTGCGGIPLGAITLISGQTTSGKLTLAYKALANAQHRKSNTQKRDTVAIVDLTHSTDPDYLVRAGIHLDHLLIARPDNHKQAIELLPDLVQSRQLRMVLVDNLADLLLGRGAFRQLSAVLGQTSHWLRQSSCSLLFLDEPSPFWQRWLNLDRSWNVRQRASLHIEMQREHWVERQGEIVGYRARARVLKSRWARGYLAAPVEIQFNGTIKARATW